MFFNLVTRISKGGSIFVFSADFLRFFKSCYFFIHHDPVSPLPLCSFVLQVFFEHREYRSILSFLFCSYTVWTDYSLQCMVPQKQWDQIVKAANSQTSLGHNSICLRWWVLMIRNLWQGSSWFNLIIFENSRNITQKASILLPRSILSPQGKLILFNTVVNF